MARAVQMDLPALPLVAQWLGFAGLVPQVALAAAVIGGPPDLASAAVRFALCYAALILSFIGGVWWGLAAQPGKRAGPWLWLAALAACDRLRREADTLEMLRGTLTESANEASRTFLTPVTRRAAGYIGQLLPGCELTFDEDLGLAGVTRAGIDESCGDLSKGTQEQLAILTRLAFADLLLEDGAPISLILDDPLVYSDDARQETMTDILQEAAKRMQVVLLTCRSKAFRHVDANRILIA